MRAASRAIPRRRGARRADCGWRGPHLRRRSVCVINRSFARRLASRSGRCSLVRADRLGIWSFTRLPVDAYPDLSPPMVEIITQWPGRASEEVERLITVPVEIGMNGIPELRVVRSISLYGLSDVIMTFQDGIDPYFAREQVFQRLADITLPDGVTPSHGAALVALRPRLPVRAAESRPQRHGAQDHR